MKFVQNLEFNNLHDDIYGGLTAAVVVLPLALAFGVASGAGLYDAIFVGTGAQVSGPMGPMTVVMAGIFTCLTGRDPVAGPALAFAVVIMGGLFQVLLGILKLGKDINLIPHPVLSGFMSSIGVIIILLQIGPLLGHD